MEYGMKNCKSETSTAEGSHVHCELRKPMKLKCAVIVVSSTRDEKSDVSGKIIRQMLEDAGHVVEIYEIVPDNVGRIRGLVREILDGDVDVIITCGGTGFSGSDVTIEGIAPLIEKWMDGFGEIFRFLSFQKVGKMAMLSRASAGVSRGKAIFCFPGSPDGAKLAAELVIEELPHLIRICRS